MSFSEAQLEELKRGLIDQKRSLQNLMEQFIQREFASEKATEHGRHGFARRCGTMRQCLSNVFSLIPPDQRQTPSSQIRKDVEINIQAFVFNLFGALDNLAWIWVLEKGLTKKNGRPLALSQIGLRSSCVLVRESFSKAFSEALSSFDDWFSHLEDFRDGLAHRIPLYIPPHFVAPEDIDVCIRLELAKTVALIKFEFDEYNELENQQTALEHFKPFMLHSLSDTNAPVVYHGQVLDDVDTLNEIAIGVLNELDELG